jgi:3-hydroxyisobutyrate dehydrogenase-like beta-hydroxyacid dehydrogenase
VPEAAFRRVGFVGVGDMGGPMARNLLASGYELVVYDRDAARMRAAAADGAVAADSVVEVAEGTDAVFLSLPGPPQVEQVVLGDGLLDRMPSGSILVCMSTVSPELVVRLDEAARPRGVAVVDAPVSGPNDVAAAGGLTIMAAGDRDVVERLRPLLEVLGAHVHYTGAVGTGQVAKLITNMLAFVHTIALMDALALGVKAGIPAEVIGGVIRTSIARSFCSEHDLPGVLNGEMPTSFPLALCVKDVRLIEQLIDEVGSPQPLADLANERFVRALDLFGPSSSANSVALLAEQASGVSIRAAT